MKTVTITEPKNLIQQAIEKGATTEYLKELMDLQERWEKKEAKKQFFEAIGKFQGASPEIRKNKKVDFGAGKATYNYAPLPDITRQILPVLQKFGLSYRWENIEKADDITVVCFISHIGGHSEKTEMSGKADTTGSKNAIQARGSLISYLRRYTLTGALGISTAENDPDGESPTLDVLHKEFMAIYNQVIQKDSTKTKWHPDNWQRERTKQNYGHAIGEIRKVLAQLTTTEI